MIQTSSLTLVDRNRLDGLLREIREHEEAARLRAGEALQHKLAIGRQLIAAREILPRGRFREWAQAELGWTARHISRHILLARHGTRVSALPPDASLRMALAAVSGQRTATNNPTADAVGSGVARYRLIGEVEFEGETADPQELVSRCHNWKVQRVCPATKPVNGSHA